MVRRGRPHRLSRLTRSHRRWLSQRWSDYSPADGRLLLQLLPLRVRKATQTGRPTRTAAWRFAQPWAILTTFVPTRPGRRRTSNSRLWRESLLGSPALGAIAAGHLLEALLQELCPDSAASVRRQHANGHDVKALACLFYSAADCTHQNICRPVLVAARPTCALASRSARTQFRMASPVE